MGLRTWLLGNGAFDELQVVRPMLPALGTMVDVGAHTGTTAVPFADAGWYVYAIEPDPENRARLVARLGQHPNVTIDDRAVLDRGGETAELFASDVSTGISTLVPFHPTHRAVTLVQTVTLAGFCDEHTIRQIDLLKIDTEGLDFFVLKGHDWTIRPEVVICEFEDRKTLALGHSVTDLAELLLDHDYSVVVSEWRPVTEYGREHQWNRYFQWGDELPGVAAWGNLIALRRVEMVDAVLRNAHRQARGATRRYHTRRIARWTLRR